MTDLNATLFFKARFDVRAKEADIDLLWDLILKIRNWICNKWRRNCDPIVWNASQWSQFKYGCSFLSKRGTVTLISSFFQEENARVNWACKIIESPDGENGCAPREWSTEIGFRQSPGEAAHLSIVVFYRDRAGFLGLLAPLPDVSAPCPRLIQALLGDEKLACSIGATPVSILPTSVSPENWNEFRSLVLDAAREVPVVYLSPRRLQPEGEETQLPLEPKTLAKVLGPNALVYYGTSIEVSRLMSEDDYEDILGCYNGGIRVFAPHPDRDLETERLRHRFLSGSFVQEQGAEAIYGLLRRALAQDISIYTSCFRVEDCRALSRRAQLEKSLAERRAQLEKSLEHRQKEIEEELLNHAIELEDSLRDDKVKGLEDQIANFDEERLDWEIEREQLENELNEARSALHQEQSRAVNFQNAAIRAKQLEKAMSEVRKISEYPSKPTQIAQFFITHFSDRLAFTNNGLASLEDCTTGASTLWAALYDMATILFDLYHSDQYREVAREFNQRSRFELVTNAGMMTRKDKGLMNKYLDQYDGRTINTESHIKSSTGKPTDRTFIRIYFAFDLQTEKLVISSVGKHRDNYSTQKLH